MSEVSLLLTLVLLLAGFTYYALLWKRRAPARSPLPRPAPQGNRLPQPAVHAPVFMSPHRAYSPVAASPFHIR